MLNIVDLLTVLKWSKKYEKKFEANDDMRQTYIESYTHTKQNIHTHAYIH